MGWQVKVGDHAYHLLTLSIQQIDELSAELGLQWQDFYPSPFGPGKPLGNAEKMVRLLAGRHDVEVPDPMTGLQLFEYWSTVDDGLPAYYQDGMPAPEAEGDHSTDGSSGDPNGTDGPPTSYADSLSVT